jgi:hypothetical protein
MPQTVFWFLEQATRGLYDGALLHRSRDAPAHVIHGGPAEDANLYQRFKQSGFDSALIQESNTKWIQSEAWIFRPHRWARFLHQHEG